jgi:hypothetical protein
LAAIKQEGLDYMGEHPCLFSEIGIPYDMDDKAAYKTGNYLSQVLAMDANHFALEGSGAAGFTLWVYMTTVSHAFLHLILLKCCRTIMNGAIIGMEKTYQSILLMTSHCL